MKLVAIVLFFFTIAASATEKPAQKPQAPTQPIVVQQQFPLSVRFDRGTDQSPFVVSNKESAEDKANAHGLTVATDNLATWTLKLAIASIVGTLFALWSTLLAWKAGRDLKKLERAYVFVTAERTGSSGSEDKGNLTLNTKAHFHNHGKTPAILKSFKLYGVYSDATPTKLIEHANANTELPDGLVIGHDKEWERAHRERLTQEQFTSLTDVVQHVFIAGLLKYEDVMGGKHEVGFCWMSQPQHHNDGVQFTICPSPLNYTK
jgi:hypothetical protein